MTTRSGMVNRLHFGIRTRPLLVGTGFFLVHLLGLLFAVFAPVLLLPGDEQRFLLWIHNGFVGAVLFTSLLALVVAVLYGLWNGGPVLATTIAAGPILTGHLLAWQPAATIDVVLGLSAAGCAAIVATVRTWYSRTDRSLDRRSSEDVTEAVSVGLALAFAGTVSGAVLLWRLVQTAGPHVSTGLWIAGAFQVVALCGLLVSIVLFVSPNRVPGFESR